MTTWSRLRSTSSSTAWEEHRSSGHSRHPPRGHDRPLRATEPEPAKLTLLDFIGHEGARILTYFSYTAGDEASIGADLATLAQLVGTRPATTTRRNGLRLARAGRALTALASGQVAGKTVLTIGRNGPRQRPDVAAGPS